MKYLNLFLLAALTGALTACGGGGSDVSDSSADQNTDLPAEQSSHLSLKIQQENLAGTISPLSNATILIYNESLTSNPQSEFTVYQTSDDGMLELDLPAENDSKVSFTVSAESFSGTVNINSFVDLKIDDYELTMLEGSFGGPYVDIVNLKFDADIAINHSGNMPDYVDLSMGVGVTGYFYQPGASKIIFESVNTFGENYKNSPVVVSTMVDDNFIFGYVNSDAIADLATNPIQINIQPQEAPIPNLEQIDVFHHSLIINNVPYFYHYSPPGKSDYPTFDELNQGQHYFMGIRGIEANFQGNDQQTSSIAASRQRRSLQSSSDASLMGEMPLPSSISVVFDEANHSYFIDADGTETYDMSYIESYYEQPNGEQIWWQIHSPVGQAITLPKLMPALEDKLQASEQYLQYFYLHDIDESANYSDAVKRLRFNNKPGSFEFFDFSSNRLTMRKVNANIRLVETLTGNKEVEKNFSLINQNR